MDNEMVVKRTTISLTPEDKIRLGELSKKERRPISQQIIHMMEFYIENKDKMK